MYADTDFLLAVIKEEDWLQSRAEEVLEEHRGDIRTSVVAVLETLLVLRRRGIGEPEAIVQDILEIAEPLHVSDETLFHAAFYLEEGSNPFDAFHAALADGPVISSDAVYDGLGVDRVDLRD